MGEVVVGAAVEAPDVVKPVAEGAAVEELGVVEELGATVAGENNYYMVEREK